VLENHLKLSRRGSEEDFLKSYREDSFIIMDGTVRRGLDGIRLCYRQLIRDLPNARFVYKSVIVEQEVGFLKWSADSDTNTVSDGADSYVIRSGYIYAQTIHYTLAPKNKSADVSKQKSG